MTDKTTWYGSLVRKAGSSLLVVFAFLVMTVPAFAHGGKGHAAGAFTALQALQKATELYDRLLVTGKLAESWETDLTRIEISNRQRDGQEEYVVSFHREVGEPSTVYIFFSADGKYAGSNFTGK